MATGAAEHAQEIRNPGPWQASSGIKAMWILFVALGAVALLAGLKVDPTRAWASFVLNHFFFMSLAVGGAFFAAIQWLTGAMWSAPIRRLSESFTAYLPVVFVSVIILYFGVPHLYLWSHADYGVGNPVLEHKRGYLNVGFFMVRNLLAVAIWWFFARKMVGNSIAQDTTKDYRFTLRNRALAPAFIGLFAITYTLSSFDQLMSLDATWFSTMFGVYAFAGLFYSTLAATCLLAVFLRAQGKLAGIVNENHLHDLGKFMFAFTVFWAYIGFSQFMLIWYANLPEETGYYLHRMVGNWSYVSIGLLLGKFIAPFFMLLPRDSKRNPKVLAFVSVWMLVFQWVDLMWIVQPQFFKTSPQVGFIEIGGFLGFFGLFGLSITGFLGRHNVVAIGDPRLPEALFHHHQ